MDNLLTLYLDNPLMGATAAARTLNISRQTVYSYLEQLEATGRIHRNGKGIEVILK
jgi:predicted transcriptional regulator